MDTPITVRQLMEQLSKNDPDAVVMVRCEDEYYTCPLTMDNLEIGEAEKVGPYNYQGPKEDHRGNPVAARTYHYDGGWRIKHELATLGEILETKPCFIIVASS